MNDNDFVWSSGTQYAPEGIYEAEFTGYEMLPKKDEMDEAVKWDFVVKEGQHAGKSTSNIGSRKPTSANSSGRIIRGLLGGDFKDGDKPNVRACIGQRYTVVVSNNRNGRPVVSQVQKK